MVDIVTIFYYGLISQQTSPVGHHLVVRGLIPIHAETAETAETVPSKVRLQDHQGSMAM